MSTESEQSTDGAQPSSASDTATVLPADATVDDLEEGQKYIAEVTNIVGYGVFVGLTPPSANDVSGLVHSSELPPLTQPDEFVVGERMVVEFLQLSGSGPEFSCVYSEHVGSADGDLPDVMPASRSAVTSDEAGEKSIPSAEADGNGAPDGPEGEPTGDDLDADTVRQKLIGDLEPDDRVEPRRRGELGAAFATDTARDAALSIMHLANNGYQASEVTKTATDGAVTVEITLEPESAETPDY